jgi:hypothetical protein
MAKFKASVSSGSASGFSNIPGASSYSVTFGKQFSKAFAKGKQKAKNKVGAPSNIPGSPAPTTAEEPVKPQASKPEKTKRSTGQLGSFSVSPGADGAEQVTTSSSRLTLKDLKSGKRANPIDPSNIPESYKPQGTRPSGRQWSEADKAALESERPRTPTFEPDTPETTARRRAELMEATAPKSRNAKTPNPSKPKKTPTQKANTSRQFTTNSQDYSNRTDVINTPQGPAVDLRGM